MLLGWASWGLGVWDKQLGKTAGAKSGATPGGMEGGSLCSFSPSACWLWAKVSLYSTTGSGPGKAKHLIHVGQRKESSDRQR